MKGLPDRMEVSLTCPECGPTVKLIVRTNRTTGSQFLGCPNWPGCLFTRQIPQDLILRAQGTQLLPGMDA